MGDIKKIASVMKLKCEKDCDHNFCLTSVSAVKFDKGEKIASTESGAKIYKCKESQSEREFVLKIIEIPDEMKYIEEKINDHPDALRHERIVKYFGNYVNGTKLYIFMEFVNGGSLHDKIRKVKPLPHEDIIKHIKQMLEGLAYLHEKKIIHRDVKPSNVLLDKEDNIKLCDFGMSRLLYSSSKSGKTPINAESRCGTYNYMAPEIMNEESYSFSVDIWSVGATAVEMVSGKAPYHYLSQSRLIVKLSKDKRIEFQSLESMSYDLENLINEMLHPEPSKRPTAQKLLNGKLFA